MNEQKNVVAEVKNDLDAILAGNSEKMVNDAERLGKHLADRRMTSSQIRNIFSEVKGMHEFEKYKLDLLRPKLAYTAGRHKQVQDLQEVLDAAIRKVGDDESKFENFKNFFEAIVAYHRLYGKEV